MILEVGAKTFKCKRCKCFSEDRFGESSVGLCYNCNEIVAREFDEKLVEELQKFGLTEANIEANIDIVIRWRI